MKNAIVLLIAALMAFHSQAQKQMVIDPNAELRRIDKSFTAIKISDAIDLYLSQSESESLAVSAATREMMDGIKTFVDGDVLNISFDGSKGKMKNKKLVVYLSFVNLTTIEATGASDISIAGTFKGKSLELKLSGASDFKGNVILNDLNIHSSGASDVRLSGKAVNLRIESSGASDIKAYDLEVEHCTAHASGASDINVTVNSEVNAVASGASNISYKGKAQLKESQSTGASKIVKRN